jgi:hypothetical protein
LLDDTAGAFLGRASFIQNHLVVGASHKGKDNFHTLATRWLKLENIALRLAQF